MLCKLLRFLQVVLLFEAPGFCAPIIAVTHDVYSWYGWAGIPTLTSCGLGTCSFLPAPSEIVESQHQSDVYGADLYSTAGSMNQLTVRSRLVVSANLFFFASNNITSISDTMTWTPYSDSVEAGYLTIWVKDSASLGWSGTSADGSVFAQGAYRRELFFEGVLLDTFLQYFPDGWVRPALPDFGEVENLQYFRVQTNSLVSTENGLRFSLGLKTVLSGRVSEGNFAIDASNTSEILRVSVFDSSGIDITDLGEFRDSSGNVIFTPVPEPSSFLALSAGLLFAAKVAQRRTRRSEGPHR